MTELKSSFCAILFHCFSINSNFSRLGKFRVERDLNPMLHWRSKVDEDQDSLMKPYFFPAFFRNRISCSENLNKDDCDGKRKSSQNINSRYCNHFVSFSTFLI